MKEERVRPMGETARAHEYLALARCEEKSTLHLSMRKLVRTPVSV